jgi:hypothetical protein
MHHEDPKIFVFCPNISAILGWFGPNTCKEYAGIVGRIQSIYAETSKHINEVFSI